MKSCIKEINRRHNGNCEIVIYEEGTRTISFLDKPRPEYPFNIDIKITDYCDLGCKMCHESSTKRGEHGDLDLLFRLGIPRGTEIAIGGGNPLSHPGLISFLERAKKRWVVSLTVNQGHLVRFRDLIKEILARELVYGLGISITSANY